MSSKSKQFVSLLVETIRNDGFNVNIIDNAETNETVLRVERNNTKLTIQISNDEHRYNDKNIEELLKEYYADFLTKVNKYNND
jgi:hypothetical protein